MERRRAGATRVATVVVTQRVVESPAPEPAAPPTAHATPDDVEHGAPPLAADATQAQRDELIANVTRHLRRHPQAQVYDDQARLRPLTGPEAEGIAQVALRAVTAWLRP